MRVTVKLFAILKERLGFGETSLELPPGATVRDAAKKMAEKYPAIASLLEKCAFAVNREYATEDRVLAEGDEAAFLPAVSGGCDDPWETLVNDCH